MKNRRFSNAKVSLLVFATVVLVYAFISMTKNCFSSAMVYIVSEGLLTKFQTGNITAVFYLVYAALQIAGGLATGAAGIPDPELIIRPSGELRLSNFLPWQSAYSEFYFTDVLWPDFSREELLNAIAAYQGRNRRFGGV